MTLAPIEEDEHIDRSEWVEWSKDDPMVKPEREAQGDMLVERIKNGDEDEIIFAQTQVHNVMNWLHEHDVLTDQHIYDGQAYERWRIIWQAAWGARKRYSGDKSDQPAVSFAEHGFLMILTRLSIRWQKIIEQAIDTHANGHERFMAQRYGRSYRDAFDRLGYVMEKIREEHQAMRDELEAEQKALDNATR